MRRLFGDYGLPRRGVVLEKGVWHSNAVKGVKLKREGMEGGGEDMDPDMLSQIEEDFERPGMSEGDKDVIVGGLAKLGIEVKYAFTSFGKATVEGGFNYFQKINSIGTSR
jgi:hypothetical protein